jgi:hypothetical protein
MIKRFFVLFSVLALTGCQTNPIEQLSYSETKELAAKLHKICQDQGVKENTSEMKLCIQQELSREAYTRRDNAIKLQRASQALASGSQQLGQSMQSSNKMVTCNTYGRTTTCY